MYAGIDQLRALFLPEREDTVTSLLIVVKHIIDVLDEKTPGHLQKADVLPLIMVACMRCNFELEPEEAAEFVRAVNRFTQATRTLPPDATLADALKAMKAN